MLFMKIVELLEPNVNLLAWVEQLKIEIHSKKP